MTGDPRSPECAEMRRRLAGGDVDDLALDHVASCARCSAFAAGLQELDATMATLSRPAPPLGAVERAVVRFQAELASGRLGPVSEQATPPPRPIPPLASPPRPVSPVTSIDNPARWRRPLGLIVAGLAAAILIVVAVVFVPGPSTHTPSASAETLHQAARSTGAQKSARLDLSGNVGLSVLGVTTQAPLEGYGFTQFPNRGRLSVTTSAGGVPIHQDIVSIGRQTWTRFGADPYQEHQNRSGRVSVIDQTLLHSDQALDQLSRVGSQYRSLGVATVTGFKTRRIQLTIPGDSFHAFGDVAQRVDRWTVIIDVGQRDLVLRRITVDGHGQVALLGSTSPFTYHLEVTLKDFGTPIDIQPPR